MLHYNRFVLFKLLFSGFFFFLSLFCSHLFSLLLFLFNFSLLLESFLKLQSGLFFLLNLLSGLINFIFNFFLYFLSLLTSCMFESELLSPFLFHLNLHESLFFLYSFVLFEIFILENIRENQHILFTLLLELLFLFLLNVLISIKCNG